MAKTLEERVQRIKDVEEIRKLFSAHAYLNGLGTEFEHRFSQQQPDVRYELERIDIFEGQESVRGRFNPPQGAAPAPAVGRAGERSHSAKCRSKHRH